jgi:hypothetical protein
MKTAIMASLPAKGDMDIEGSHTEPDYRLTSNKKPHTSKMAGFRGSFMD